MGRRHPGTVSGVPVAMIDSPLDLAALLLLALLLFGAKRLPDIARSLGTGMREFRDSINGVKPETTEPSPPPALQASATEQAPPPPDEHPPPAS